MERNGFQYTHLINDFQKSVHGDLQSYKKTTYEAAISDPEFLAHFISWNFVKGEIRDSKIAIPILSLRKLKDNELIENSVAALMTLDPRSLVKAYRLNKTLSTSSETMINGSGKVFREAIRTYLSIRENIPGWWVKTAVQHRKSLKELYAVSHLKPSIMAQNVLFDKVYKRKTVFAEIADLKNKEVNEAVGIILNHNIPFQIALGALGKSKEEYVKHPEYALAFMSQMSGQQLINNTKFLTTLGVFNDRMLESEYNKALERAKKDKKVSTLKAGKAIENLSSTNEDKRIEEKIKEKLSCLQETKMEKTGGIEGDWLVLGDMSGSMQTAIKTAIEIASVLTRSVKGKVYLVFFNSMPRLFEVTGLTLEQIKDLTRNISANGATSCGCGIELLQEKQISVNGVAIISDGGDNKQPYFVEAYEKYAKWLNYEPNVYFFKLLGDWGYRPLDTQMEMNIFDFTNKTIDYYSLPNLVKTMKTKKYGLLDEIMETPLLTLKKVFE